MPSAAPKQDMPPEGGYKAIPFKRIPARTFFNGYTLIGGYLGMTAGAAYIYFLNYVNVHKETLEIKSGRLAIYPLLLAERDREYLKQLRRNQEEESKLMANVEGWKVGTWYGEPIYETRPDSMPNPNLADFYTHSSVWDFLKRSFFDYLT